VESDTGSRGVSRFVCHRDEEAGTDHQCGRGSAAFRNSTSIAAIADRTRDTKPADVRGRCRQSGTDRRGGGFGYGGSEGGQFF